MEWGSKSSTWNAMSKLQIEHSMFESSISTSDTFSVDLKLGSLEHMEDVPMETFKNSRALTMASSSHPPSSPLSKRGRPRGAGVQSTVYCSVDGCISDLSQGREYNRRHKVCERHSKTPVVHIGGAEQRFCQQCSRFHSLVEFDDAKRSCRKRLDGHNRRRRKSQPENLYMNNSCCLQTPYTGSKLMQLSSPENWPVISAPAKALYSTEASFDRATELGSSECALSLLSRYPTQSSGVCMGPTVPQLAMTSSAQVNSTSLYMDYSLAQFSCSKGLEDGSSAPLSNLSFTNNSHLLDGFHLGQDGFTGNRSSRLFPFSLE